MHVLLQAEKQGEKTKRISLESKLDSLENNITVTSMDLELKQYNSVKQELEQIHNYITEGIILRTRTVWYEEGEKSTKYFLNLEKRGVSLKCIFENS